MAARATWNGTLTFGLVSFPVSTFKAVEENDVRFNTFHVVGDEFHPMGRMEIDKVTGEVVARADVTRAFVYDGSPVPVSDDELDKVAPVNSKVLEISEFVPGDSINPLYYTKHEYLGAGKGGDKGYAVLWSALDTLGMVGLAKTTRRTKEHAVAIRAMDDGVLLMSYLAAPDEVRDHKSFQPSGTVDSAHIVMACNLIQAMAKDFDPDFAKDNHRESVMAMIAAKAGGLEVCDTAAKVPVSEVLDMLDALQASLEAVAK